MGEAYVFSRWFEAGHEVTVTRVPDPELPDYRGMTERPVVVVISKPEVQYGQNPA